MSKVELKFNLELIENIKQITTKLPHLILVGKKGCGKRTILDIILKELYGNNVYNDVKIREKTYKSNNLTRTIHIWESRYFIKLDSIEASNSDYRVFQQILKTYLRSNYLDKIKYKLIILNYADYITLNAQNVLCSLLDKSFKYRFLLIANDIEKISKNVISRCNVIQIPSPTNKEIKEILNEIIIDEDLESQNHNIDKVLKLSNRNLTRALYIIRNNDYNLLNWEIKLNEAVQLVLHDPKTTIYFSRIRKTLLNVLSNGVPCNLVFEHLVKQFLLLMDSKYHYDILQKASYYSAKVTKGINEILHVEPFITSIMKLI